MGGPVERGMGQGLTPTSLEPVSSLPHPLDAVHGPDSTVHPRKSTPPRDTPPPFGRFSFRVQVDICLTGAVEVHRPTRNIVLQLLLRRRHTQC